MDCARPTTPKNDRADDGMLCGIAGLEFLATVNTPNAFLKERIQWALNRYTLRYIFAGLTFHPGRNSGYDPIISTGVAMGEKGKKDKSKREDQKKPKLTIKEKRKKKKDKKKA